MTAVAWFALGIVVGAIVRELAAHLTRTQDNREQETDAATELFDGSPVDDDDFTFC